MMFAYVIIGELIPWTMALYYGEQTSLVQSPTCADFEVFHAVI